ncbi:hypothetical protein [Roseivivax sp.]
MFDFQRQPSRLHTFLAENGEGLQNAALMLGGRRWLRRVQHLLDEAFSHRDVTRRMTCEVRQLQGLLHLEHVADLESPEAAYFAELDPGEPCVEEICLLADALDEALEGDLDSEERKTPSEKAMLS